VNGTLVNGKRVDHRVLQVGDVIQIEGFQLTFVLDHQPIEGAMKPVAAAAPEVDSRLMTVLEGVAMEMLPDESGPPARDAGRAAPGPLADDAGRAAPGPLADDEERAAPGPPADEDGGELELLDSVELEDSEAEGEEGKPLAAVQPRGSSRASSVQELGPVADPPLGLVLELRLRLEELPEPLRVALCEAEVDGQVLPAELQLRITR
jgi:hypothetical protein